MVKTFLRGIVIAKAGALPDPFTDENLVKWTELRKGTYSKEWDDTVTHLLCTTEHFKTRKRNDRIKKALQKGRSVRVVHVDWYELSCARNKRLQEREYSLDRILEQENIKLREQKAKEILQRNLVLGDSWFNPDLYRVFIDKFHFKYEVEIIQTREDKFGLSQEKWTLYLYESFASPRLYWFGARFSKKTDDKPWRPSKTWRPESCPGRFKPQFRQFKEFFKTKTKIDWPDRIIKAGTTAKEHYQYTPPTRGKPVGGNLPLGLTAEDCFERNRELHWLWHELFGDEIDDTLQFVVMAERAAQDTLDQIIRQVCIPARPGDVLKRGMDAPWGGFFHSGIALLDGYFRSTDDADNPNIISGESDEEGNAHKEWLEGQKNSPNLGNEADDEDESMNEADTDFENDKSREASHEEEADAGEEDDAVRLNKPDASETADTEVIVGNSEIEDAVLDETRIVKESKFTAPAASQQSSTRDIPWSREENRPFFPFGRLPLWSRPEAAHIKLSQTTLQSFEAYVPDIPPSWMAVKSAMGANAALVDIMRQEDEKRHDELVKKTRSLNEKRIFMGFPRASNGGVIARDPDRGTKQPIKKRSGPSSVLPQKRETEDITSTTASKRRKETKYMTEEKASESFNQTIPQMAKKLDEEESELTIDDVDALMEEHASAARVKSNIGQGFRTESQQAADEMSMKPEDEPVTDETNNRTQVSPGNPRQDDGTVVDLADQGRAENDEEDLNIMLQVLATENSSFRHLLSHKSASQLTDSEDARMRPAEKLARAIQGAVDTTQHQGGRLDYSKPWFGRFLATLDGNPRIQSAMLSICGSDGTEDDREALYEAVAEAALEPPNAEDHTDNQIIGGNSGRTTTAVGNEGDAMSEPSQSWTTDA